MTVSTTDNSVQYDIDGETTEFSFTFVVYESTDVYCYLVDSSGTQTAYTDFSIVLNTDNEGGTITTNTTITTSEAASILIIRDTPLTQGLDLIEGGEMPANSLENAFDKTTMIVQDQQSALDRSLKTSKGVENPYNLSGSLTDGNMLYLDGEQIKSADNSNSDLSTAITNANSAASAANGAASGTNPGVASQAQEQNLGQGSKIYPPSPEMYVSTTATSGVSVNYLPETYEDITVTHIRILSSESGKVETVRFWETPTLPATVTSVTANDYAGYDVVTDEGTFECVPNDIYEKRLAGKVSGWGAVADYNRGTLSGTDSTQQLLKAAEYANTSGNGTFILDNTEISDALGYYTTESLDLTNVKQFRSNMNHIYVRSGEWTGDTTDYVLAFGDPDGDYTDINGDLSYDFIDVYDCDNRDTELNGIFIRKTHLQGGDIRARRFNGTGLNWSPVWDSVVGHLDVQYSGNLTTYAYIAQGGGDETNACTIAGIVLHYNYHKIMSFSGSKNALGNIHCEGNYVLSTDDGTTGLSSSLTYVNYYIALTSSTLENIDFNDWDSDSSSWSSTADDGTTTVLDAPTSVQIVFGASHISKIYSKNTVFAFQNASGQAYGNIGYFGGSKFYGSDTARINIDSIYTSFFNALSANCNVMGGRITELGVCNANLYNVTIDNEVTVQSTLSCSRYHCTFSGGLSAVGDTVYVNHFDCTIGDVSLNTASERARFRDCVMDSFTATLAKDIGIYGGRINGDYTQTFVTSQNILTDGVKVEGTVTGWTAPSGAIENTKMNRLGATSGEGVDYIYVNSAWNKLTELP